MRSQSQDVYGEPRVFKFPGMTVRVYQPILTDEERARRMKRIEEAAAAVLIEQEKLKRRKREYETHENEKPAQARM